MNQYRKPNHLGSHGKKYSYIIPNNISLPCFNLHLLSLHNPQTFANSPHYNPNYYSDSIQTQILPGGRPFSGKILENFIHGRNGNAQGKDSHGKILSPPSPAVQTGTKSQGGILSQMGQTADPPVVEPDSQPMP